MRTPAYLTGVNHVLNRGDRCEPIFRDDADRQRFLETLGEACAKTGWQVHAYCLMLNPFSSGVGIAQGQSRDRYEMVPGHLHFKV